MAIVSVRACAIPDESAGTVIVAGEIRGLAASAATLGTSLAEELLGRGADAILRRLLETH